MRNTGDLHRLRIGVVGPCAAGKSTLIKYLQAQSELEIRHIAQEHSYVQTMWQRISHPDWLIFLDVSYPVTMQRRNLNWTEEEYQEQQRRLAHARQNADFYLMTDMLDQSQVAQMVIQFLKKVGAWHSNDSETNR